MYGFSSSASNWNSNNFLIFFKSFVLTVNQYPENVILKKDDLKFLCSRCNLSKKPIIQHHYQSNYQMSINSSPLSDAYESVIWVSIGSGNGLLPVWHQAITLTNAGLLSSRLLGINFSESWIRILSFSFKGGDELKHLKSPATGLSIHHFVQAYHKGKFYFTVPL